MRWKQLTNQNKVGQCFRWRLRVLFVLQEFVLCVNVLYVSESGRQVEQSGGEQGVHSGALAGGRH